MLSSASSSTTFTQVLALMGILHVGPIGGDVGQLSTHTLSTCLIFLYIFVNYHVSICVYGFPTYNPLLHFYIVKKGEHNYTTLSTLCQLHHQRNTLGKYWKNYLHVRRSGWVNTWSSDSRKNGQSSSFFREQVLQHGLVESKSYNNDYQLINTHKNSKQFLLKYINATQDG